MFTLLVATQEVSEKELEAINEEPLPAAFVQTNNVSGEQKYSITVPGPIRNQAFEIFKAELAIDHRVCPELPEHIHTLREWCTLYEDINKYYPLLHVILNVEAPPKNGPMSPEYYEQVVYTAMFNNKKHLRLSADAPARLFAKLMVKEFSGKPKKGDNVDSCYLRFRDNVIEQMIECGFYTEAQKDTITSEYEPLLRKLFAWDGQRSCYNIAKEEEHETFMELAQRRLEEPVIDIRRLPEARKRELALSAIPTM